jgi:hypothetical protein
VTLMDAVAKSGAATCYVEVLSKPVIRVRKPQKLDSATTEVPLVTETKA